MSPHLKRTLFPIFEPALFPLLSNFSVSRVPIAVQSSYPFTGFWTEEVEIPPDASWRETEVRGERFFVVEIKKKVLFPSRTGKLGIEPAVFSFGAPPRQRTTRRLTLRVDPLPALGRPQDFSGAVGELALRAFLDREAAKVGDSIALTVTGRGNLKTLEPPRLPGFRSEGRRGLEGAPLRLRGGKRWTYVLTPEWAGRLRADPNELHYFDLVKKRYVKLEAEPLFVDVSPARAAESGEDALPCGLKPLPEKLGRAPFHRSASFYASLLLPVVWNLGLLAYRKRVEAERAEPRLFRSRRAHRIARARLGKAAKLAREESKLFYEEVATALYLYVADKAGESPASLTAKRIDEILEAREIPGGDRIGCRRAIEEAETARFTPGPRSREEMEGLLRRAEEILVSLERRLG